MNKNIFLTIFSLVWLVIAIVAILISSSVLEAGKEDNAALENRAISSDVNTAERDIISETVSIGESVQTAESESHDTSYENTEEKVVSRAEENTVVESEVNIKNSVKETSSYDNQAEIYEKVPGLNDGGTTCSNIFNGGFICRDAENIYYRYSDGCVYKQSASDGSADPYKSQLILNKQVFYLNVCKGWLYFWDCEADCLAKCDINGNNYSVLKNEPVHEVNIDGEWIYYCTNNGIYRMKTDGTNDTLLVSVSGAWYQQEAGDYIYYVRTQDNRALCRCSKDGTNEEVILDSDVYDVLVYSNIIYYTRGKDERFLYALDMNKHETYNFNSSYTRWLNRNDDSLFYTNKVGETSEGVSVGNTIFKIKMNETFTDESIYQISSLSSNVEGICIIDNVIYYMDSNQILYSLDIN